MPSKSVWVVECKQTQLAFVRSMVLVRCLYLRARRKVRHWLGGAERKDRSRGEIGAGPSDTTYMFAQISAV